MKVEFVKSAQDHEQAPPANRPEVALAGRSNAGKSSFLNTFCGRKIAKVSQQPGKTRLLNFFNVGPRLRLTDMPGYGYAARSKSEREAWGKMVEPYLTERENLVGLILVMDIRRDWAEEEEQIQGFCDSVGLPFAIVLTKADKLSRNQQASRRLKLKKSTHAQEIFVVSNLKKTGQKEVERFIFDAWIDNKSNSPEEIA
jgi:GTP-binding protein